jgi:hypothetical protein
MAEIIDWARDLLVSRGALVETGEAGALSAMLSPELAKVLQAGDWLSLRFAAGAGSDDAGDWLDRFGRMLPPDARVSGARLRRLQAGRPVDAGAVLERELVIQNGIYRLLEDYQGVARYYFFTFSYAIESDETSQGVWTACLNSSANSLVRQPESLLEAVRDELEEDPEFAVPRMELSRLFPLALRGTEPEVRRLALGMEHSANRRMARDAERINSYYRDLLSQIQKRIARHKGDATASEKERSRAAATELDRAAKLDDLARKYSLKIRIEPGDVLVVTLPVREIKLRVIRKKVERMATLHWNVALGKLEHPWCESCSAPAHPLFLCDDRVHFLCKSCLAPCANCQKQFCRKCQTKCKCGSNAGTKSR